MTRLAPPRIPLAGLMALIGLFAAGLGAMRDGSAVAAIAVAHLTLLALLTALVGTVARRGEGSWVGFALFGWGYGVIALMTTPGLQLLHLAPMVEGVVERLHPPDGPAPSPPALGSEFLASYGDVAKLPPLPKGDLRRSSLTPSEDSALDAYYDQSASHEATVSANHARRLHAQEMGYSFMILFVASAGALVGRAVGTPRPPIPRAIAVPAAQEARRMETAGPSAEAEPACPDRRVR